MTSYLDRATSQRPSLSTFQARRCREHLKVARITPAAGMIAAAFWMMGSLGTLQILRLKLAEPASRAAPSCLPQEVYRGDRDYSVSMTQSVQAEK